MRFSLDWLADYVKIHSQPAELAERITLSSVTLEQIITAPLPVQEARLVRIQAIQSHPNADKLSVVTVKYQTATRKVVCGANNIQIKDVVVLILPKGHYFDANNELQILNTTTIRGVVSQGMLASEKDLGISDNHTGIMKLPANSNLSYSLVKILGWERPILDFEITPNRSDLFSYLGLAREVSLLEKTRLIQPVYKPVVINSADSKPLIDPIVKTKGCMRYTALVVTNLVNQPSPHWLANRLSMTGIRPINAIVDITNYVMLELGQPLHAFDFNKLSANKHGRVKLEVRLANKAELLESLDGQHLQLSDQDMVISDQSKVAALAGVIGASSTETDLATKTIVLESAIFDPAMVRRTANRCKVRTEAVTRFEKGIDSEITILALKRAYELMQDICGGRAVGRLHDINQSKPTKLRLTLSLERAKKNLGIYIDIKEAKTALSYLGFQVSSTGQKGLSIIVPTFRPDITREEDIFEELVRIYGYNKLPVTLPQGNLPVASGENVYFMLRKIRKFLTKNRLTEIITQPFYSSELANIYNINTESIVEILNPTSKNEQFLRHSLLPNLSQRTLQQSRQYQYLAAYELGNTFEQQDKELHESTKLGLCYLTNKPEVIARKIKFLLQIIPKVIEKDGELEFKTATTDQAFYQDKSEQIIINNKVIGTLGVINNKITERGKLKGDRWLITAELDLQPILKLPVKITRYSPPPIYPAITRDISLDLKAETSIREAITLIEAKPLKNITSITLQDIFRSNTRCTITLRLVFQARESTLEDDQVNKEITKLIRYLQKYNKVKLRGE